MPNLLVVDDDEQMLSSLLDVLGKAGYEVTGAASGPEAIDRAGSLALDLVVSDVRMAGMDGIETISRLRSGCPDLKSIIITGYASDDVPARAMDLASCDYLFKPFTDDQLIQSVSRALARSEQVDLSAYPPAMQEAIASLAAMETSRRRAFQNYYLGIRSSHLKAAAALVIYDALETAELLHQSLEKQLELRFSAGELQENFEGISARCKTPASLGGLPRKTGGPTRVEFQPLYNSLRDGKLDWEQIRSAIHAREKVKSTSDPLEQAVSEAVYSALWG